MAVETSIPSASSIVDYLNTKGQDSSFGARKKLYSDMGFEKRLGSFVGGANQNLALLRELQKTDSASSKPPAEVMAPAPAPNAQTDVPKLAFNIQNPATSLTSGGIGRTQTSTPMFASDFLKSAGFKDVPPPTPAPAPAATDVVETQKAPSVQSTTAPGMATPDTSKQTDSETLNATGLSAASIYPDVFGDKTTDVNEADYINRWLSSAEGKLFLDRQNLVATTNEAKAEALKKELESKYKSEKESLEQKLAENGLAFSGIRATKVKALADALAASELEVDRDIASKLLDANLDLREAILKGVADLAKEADAGRKEAIQQLNAIGYAVVGGQLVPTLSALSGERAQRSLELSERRLQLAEEAASKPSGNKLTLSEATSRNLPSYLVGTSEEEVANSFYDKDAPAWFSRKVQEDNGQKLPAETVQKLWEQQAPKYRTGIKDSENHTKAVKFFSAFSGTTPEVAEGYAGRVDFYMNAGNSYADALQKVQKEINDALKKAGQKKIDWSKYNS